jgi:hypothetical protein
MLSPLHLLHLGKRSYILLGGSVLLAAVVALAASVGLNRPDPVTLPDETAIHVTLDQTVASDQSRPGDHFEATVSEPIVVKDKTVVPAGAPVEGLVIDAHHSGRLMGRARLQLALETVTVNGKSYDIRTATRTRIGGNHNRRNLAIIGGGAGGGALIGAVAAGGKGALIGGPIGAGVGTAAAFITGKKDIILPAETPLTFTLAEPVTVNAKG